MKRAEKSKSNNCWFALGKDGGVGGCLEVEEEENQQGTKLKQTFCEQSFSLFVQVDLLNQKWTPHRRVNSFFDEWRVPLSRDDKLAGRI